MDIEFVELEHRSDINTLMQVCGINLQTAYHLYHRHHCNLQAALSENLGLVSPLRQEQPREEELAISAIMAASFDEDNDPEFNKYCKFVESGVHFFKKYPIKNAINPAPKGIKPPKSANLENLSFKKDLEEALQTRLDLKIEAGQVADGLAWSWRERFPIAVLVLNLQQNVSEGAKEALNNKRLTQQLCTYFKLYAVDSNSTALPSWLSPFLSPEDSGSIVVMRVNCMDEIQTVAKVKLSSTATDIGQSLQKAKSACIQREYDQAHLIKQHAMIRNRGPGYRRPPSIKERIKQKEDARLRRQQDEEFMKACFPKQKKRENEEMKEQIKQARKQEDQPSTQELKQKRERKRKEMVIYSQGLRFKLRMPSGKNEHLFVSGQQTVHYLFDYVDSCSEQIGFERDHKRSFDIVYGPEKNQSLLSVKNAKIDQILQDAELLIVKQLDQL